MGQGDSSLATIQGFQVARVLPNSPAHVAGLLPYFDIITAVDHLPLSTEGSDFFKTYIKKNTGHTVTITVFNLRIRAYRDVPLVPTDQWGGAGLLGCSIDWTSAERCVANTWHIVDVSPDSAAASHTDVLQQRDYIIGMQPADEQVITMLRDEADFGQRLSDWKRLRQSNPRDPSRNSLLLLIYDSVDNCIKEVLLNMQGKEALGIDVANGYLHVIPPTPGSQKLPTLKKFVVLDDAANHDAAARKHSAHLLHSQQFPEAPSVAKTNSPAVEGSRAPVPMPAERPDVLSPISPPSPRTTPVLSSLSVGHEPATEFHVQLPPALLFPSAPSVQPPVPPVTPPSKAQPTITLPPPLHFPTFPQQAAAH